MVAVFVQDAVEAKPNRFPERKQKPIYNKIH
jgi:hypothetical protein